MTKSGYVIRLRTAIGDFPLARPGQGRQTAPCLCAPLRCDRCLRARTRMRVSAAQKGGVASPEPAVQLKFAHHSWNLPRGRHGRDSRQSATDTETGVHGGSCPQSATRGMTARTGDGVGPAEAASRQVAGCRGGLHSALMFRQTTRNCCSDGKTLMVRVKRVVLDVLKPHSPNGLQFASLIAERDSGCRVTLRVVEIDEKTETVELAIEGEDIDLEAVIDGISGMGASVHSIDEVEVVNVPRAPRSAG